MAQESSIEVKVLENPQENWRSLIEMYLESRKYNPITSPFTSWQTTHRSFMEEGLRQMVESTNCPIIIAWDLKKQKVAGAIFLRGIDRVIVDLPYEQQPGAYKMEGFDWDEETTSMMQELFTFFTPLRLEMDIFKHYPDVENYAEILACGVLQEYARQGLAGKIMEKALDVLREMKYQMVYGTFVSVYSIKLAVKLGFEHIVSRKYDDYPLSNKIPASLRAVHKDIHFSIKRL